MSMYFNPRVTILMMMTAIPLIGSTKKRPPLVITCYAVVDKSGYDHWVSMTGNTDTAKLRREIRSVFWEVNKILATLEERTCKREIRVNLRVYIYPTTSIADTSFPLALEKSDTYRVFLWLQQKRLKSYDVGMLFTRDTYKRDYSHFRAKICHHAPVYKAVKFSGTYLDVFATTQMIADSVGAELCPTPCGNKNNVMYEKVADIEKAEFSNCSAQCICEYTQSLQCIFGNYTYEGNSGPLYSSIVTPDEVCKRRFGRSSSFGRMYYDKFGDNACKHFKCHVPGKSTVQEIAVSTGISCGKGKQCFGKKCVRKESGDMSLSKTCPFGDQPDYMDNGKLWTCKKAIKDKGCGDKRTRSACCQSCFGL